MKLILKNLISKKLCVVCRIAPSTKFINILDIPTFDLFLVQLFGQLNTKKLNENNV